MSWFRHLWGAAALALLLGACALRPSPAALPQPYPTILPGAELVEQHDASLPFPLRLPPGFRITRYADGLEEVRSVVFSPAGVPHVTVMNRKAREAGKVLALPDDDGDGRADRTVVVLDGLDRPHGIAFHGGFLYVAEPDTVWRLRDADGDLLPDERVAVVENLAQVSGHLARPLLFDDAGRLLVAIGSTCNACKEEDPRHGAILRFDVSGARSPAAPGEIYASGLRSVVGMTFRPGTQELWALDNGADHLGREQPPDLIVRVEQGVRYGWPYCYGDRVPDISVQDNPEVAPPDDGPVETFCRDRAGAPAILLPTHVAPLGVIFYTGDRFPPELRGDMFVTLHGSHGFVNQYGYKVIRIPFKNGRPASAPQDFITGWAPEGADIWLGRPLDVEQAPDGTLFVTDDANGFLYRVDYVGGR
ncbi:MAG TPA: PQQ-dependent sugar dehydrogenase [Roseiflexaceae bacterium]|nr:PQQ-dependent sugar dehydrogenase [Roseiflexaceae bacterium]